jgi:hypothetical protein
MERFSVKQCRALIGQSEASALGEEEVLRLRDMLYVLGDVIADAFADLNTIDQTTFQPQDDLDEWMREIGGGA